MGDGAPWIWNLAGKLLPKPPDRGHLPRPRTPPRPAATVAFIVTDPAQWLTDRLADLDNGDIEAIIAAATEYPVVGVKATDRDRALTYFETNAVRMRYRRYRDLGMFIGSGNVEAGCKAVIGQRLKLSGMRWTREAPVPPPASSPCAANKPAASTTRSGPPHNQIPATDHQAYGT